MQVDGLVAYGNELLSLPRRTESPALSTIYREPTSLKDCIAMEIIGKQRQRAKGKKKGAYFNDVGRIHQRLQIGFGPIALPKLVARVS